MKLKSANIKIIFFLFFMQASIFVFGQCKINAPQNICLGNLAYFTISTPTGSKISSILWKFGDGYSSNVQTPGHLYKISGSYKVSCILALKSGGQCKDSIIVNILKLPKAEFKIISIDSCVATNQITLKNLSNAAEKSRPITNAIIIWDDGAINLFDSIKSYKYKQAGNYKISLEVTDNMGCKDIFDDSVRIYPIPVALFSYKIDTFCGYNEICLRNKSDKSTYIQNQIIWQFDNEKPVTEYFKKEICTTLLRSRFVKMNISVVNIYGCKNSYKDSIRIIVQKMNEIRLEISDTSVCFGAKIKAVIVPDYSYKYLWSSKEESSSIIIDTKKNGKVGLYYVSCTIGDGACKKILDTMYRVKGPKADIFISPKNLCEDENKVFFIDSSEITDYAKSSRLWVIHDSLGDSCITYREKKINKYKNCNYCHDWYHKHFYHSRKEKNRIDFFVYDSITGCMDSAKDFVNTNFCSPTQSYCDSSFGCFKIFNIIIKKPYCKVFEFSLDNGITWYKNPWKIEKGFKKGYYDVYYKYIIDSSGFYDYGDDSLIYYKDSTIDVNSDILQNQYIDEQFEQPNSRFSIKISKDCNFKDVYLSFDDKTFDYGEFATINWGDGSYTKLDWKKYKPTDTIKHRYNYRVFNDSIIVKRVLKNDCDNSDTLPIGFGNEIINNKITNNCLGDTTYINLSVYNMATFEKWTEFTNFGKVKIISGENDTFENKYKFGIKYKNSGEKSIKFIVSTIEGCIDSFSQIIKIYDLFVGVTSDSKIFGCGEIKQLFDSSIVLYDINFDTITNYSWDFGTNKYQSTQQNPYHRFTKYGKYIVSHAIKSKMGCEDTVRFVVDVPGPQSNFEIKDTISCEPFTVTFINKSKHCIYNYWSFGDIYNTTSLLPNTDTVYFTYYKPGKYFINLTAIDTFYSKTTSSTYYCRDSFPLNRKDRTITVLPIEKALFWSEDTICIKQKVNFTNQSSSKYTKFLWDFGDGKQKTIYGHSSPFQFYNNAGKYKITLFPDYDSTAGIPKCLDTAEREIQVVGTNADFGWERICESPFLQFVNKSNPQKSVKKYNWDFGQPDFPKNKTNDTNPSHDYGYNKGEFTICLNTIDIWGCRDTICKSIINDYKTKLYIPNVFTPEVLDNKNDAYDIDIEGEELYELFVYNRWGLLVYHSKTDGIGNDGINWNGRVSNTGKECPEGTYFYILEYNLCYGDREQKRVSGTITLIR